MHEWYTVMEEKSWNKKKQSFDNVERADGSANRQSCSAKWKCLIQKSITNGTGDIMSHFFLSPSFIWYVDLIFFCLSHTLALSHSPVCLGAEMCASIKLKLLSAVQTHNTRLCACGCARPVSVTVQSILYILNIVWTHLYAFIPTNLSPFKRVLHAIHI